MNLKNTRIIIIIIIIINRLFLKHFAVERLNYMNIYTNIYGLNMKLK